MHRRARRQRYDDASTLCGGEKEGEKIDGVVKEDAVAVARRDTRGDDRRRSPLGAFVQFRVGEPLARFDGDKSELVRRKAGPLGEQVTIENH